MSLLEQDITRKGWIEEIVIPEFDKGNNKEYEMEAI